MPEAERGAGNAVPGEAQWAPGEPEVLLSAGFGRGSERLEGPGVILLGVEGGLAEGPLLPGPRWTSGEAGTPQTSGAPGHRARRAAGRFQGLQCSGSLPSQGADLAPGHTWPGPCGLRVAWEAGDEGVDGLVSAWNRKGNTRWTTLSFLQTSQMSLLGLLLRPSEGLISQLPQCRAGAGGPCRTWGVGGRAASGAPRIAPCLASCIVLSSRGGVACSEGPEAELGVPWQSVPGTGGSRHCLPSEQPPSFLSAQPAPWDLGLTTGMELGPATKTFVLELRCLEDGGPGPDTLSGEGLGGSDLLNQEESSGP